MNNNNENKLKELINDSNNEELKKSENTQSKKDTIKDQLKDVVVPMSEQEKKTINNKKKSDKIVVVGSGAFGTAVAESLIRDETKDNEVIIFGINVREINDINRNHKNSKYYSLKLSPNLYATTDPEEAFSDADIIMIALPSMVVKAAIIDTIIPNMTKPAYFINLAKGFDYINVDILSNVIKETVPKDLNKGVLKLAGASFASEVIHKQPTAFVLAADNIETSNSLYRVLNNKTMKVIPSEALDSVEWLSIIKNPLALLQGLVAGLGYKVNTRALFFTQAVNEMRRLLKFLDLDEQIIFSPAGVGDMYLTGSSRKSRNYATGYEIGKANKVTKKALQKFTTTEGLRSVEILLRLSRKNKLNLKSIEILYAITYKKENPADVIEKYLDKF